MTKAAAQSPEMQVTETLRSIHSGMVTTFQVDFPFFHAVKVLEQQSFLVQLARRMQVDLKKSSMAWGNVRLGQVTDKFMRGQPVGSAEHFAFYSPQTDTLCLNTAMIVRYPEKVLSVCAHELAEKLLSTYVSPPKKSSTSSAAKLYFEVTKTHDVKKHGELLDVYVGTVFATVFKEGCSEAIAVQTLRNMHFSTEAEVLERELLSGYPRCLSLLSRAEDASRNWAQTGTIQSRSSLTAGQRLIKDFLKITQVIKGASYYIGYPLAKAVLDKHGLEGMRFAMENNPPVEARFFADPESYLVTLRKS